MKKLISLYLAVMMLLSAAAAPASAMTQEEMLERVRQAMATPTPQPTAPPAPEEEPAESREEAPAADDAAAEETAQAPAAANGYEGLYRTTGYTPVYTDAAMKKGAGLIQGKSVVLVLEKAGYAYKIFFACGKTGAEGYVDESTLIRLNEAEAAAYLSQTDGTAVSKKGYRLMPVTFTAMGKGPQQVTPEPEAEPTPAPAAQPAAEEAPADEPAAEQPAQEPEDGTPDAPEAAGGEAEPEALSESPEVAQGGDAAEGEDDGTDPQPVEVLTGMNTEGPEDTVLTSVIYVVPLIEQEPSDQVISGYGESVTFTMKAAEAVSSYQWQYSTDGNTWADLTNGNVWIGHKTDTLTFSAKESWKNWLFRCAVTGNDVTEYTQAVGFYVDSGMLRIIQSPENQTVSAGQTAVFSVTATGAKTYRWQYSTDGTSWADLTNGNVWKGKDTATLSFTAKESWRGWQFRCVVSDGTGRLLISNKAILYVTSGAAFAITRNPADQTVSAGQTAVFSVTATGAKTYRWQYSTDGTSWADLTNGNVWKGKDTATLSFTVKESWRGWQFRCVVSDGTGNLLISNKAVLYVNSGAAFAITKHPADQTVSAGQTAVFSVTATGAETYRWQYSTDGTSWADLTNGNVWKGKDTATLSFTAKESWNGWQFRCVVSDGTGRLLISNKAVLYVNGGAAFAITRHPADQTVSAGQTATFSVTATGAETYRWQYSTDGTSWADLTNGNVWKGKDTAQLSFTVKESWRGWQFRCKVSDGTGRLLISNKAVLNVKGSLVIVKQPESTTVRAGEQGSFSAEASGAESYVWQYRTGPSGSWADLTNGNVWKGKNTARLSFTAKESWNGWQFRCVVGGAGGSAASEAASLKVIPAQGTADSGKCGDGVWWILYENGLLEIYGKGPMYDYSEELPPWDAEKGGITAVRIGSGVTRIGFKAFAACANLTSLAMPDSLEQIAAEAFSDCTALTGVAFPGGLQTIGGGAFSGCEGLTGIELPSGVTKVGALAFADCTGLLSAYLPSGLTDLGSGAFMRCSALRQVTLPAQNGTIREWMFSDCTSLPSVTIPAAVMQIRIGAFGSCTSLTDVFYTGTQEQWDAIGIGTQNTPLLNARLHLIEEPKVTVSADRESAGRGETVTLTAVLSGAAGAAGMAVAGASGTMGVKWQSSADGVSWQDLGAYGQPLKLILTAERESIDGVWYRCVMKDSLGVWYSNAVTVAWR